MKTKAMFLHHSTGANLLFEGNVRILLNKKFPGVALWDHGYSFGPFAIVQNISHHIAPYLFGLSDHTGSPTGKDYGLKLNNTNPDGYAAIFNQPLIGPAANEFSRIMEYDVIIFKSCYPVTKIISDRQLTRYKQWYVSIRKRIDEFPNNLFVLFTPPPLRLSLTQKEYALRARCFAKWLSSNEFLEKRKNMLVFDFFDLLADNITHTLKPEYCRSSVSDSHPNIQANKKAAILFVDFFKKIQTKLSSIKQQST